MNRINRAFEDIKKQKRIGIIPYITVGVPNINVTYDLICMFDSLGVTAVELGVPFSDPLADGPVIQASSQIAIANNITLAKTLSLVRRVRKTLTCPLVVMTYYNILYQLRPRRLVSELKGAGVDGLVVPDLAWEEDRELYDLCCDNDIANILIVTRTTSEERMKKLAKLSRGFIYYTTHTGTTGAQKVLSADIPKNVKRIRKHTKTPIGIGFGISRREHLRALAGVGDAAIIGSAIIKIILETTRGSDVVKNVEKFIKRIWA